MQNTKFIKIIIIILIPLIVLFSLIYINRSTSQNTKPEVITEETQDNQRVIFNTNTNTQTNFSTSTEISTNVNVVEYSDGEEDVVYNKINKILLDWDITKDQELLKQALVLSESADNEAILESWRPFMSKNSSELIKLINSSSNSKQTKINISLIFQWYIELSGDYQNLTPNKKQEISNQYNQLK